MSDIKKIIAKVNKELKAYIDPVDSSVPGWISTGSTLLDAAVKEGLPIGRIVELTGKSGTGKSALSFSILAETQKAGGIGVLIDTERAIDLDFARKFGVDIDDLIYCAPENVEDIYDFVKEVVTTVRGNEKPNEFVPLTVIVDSCTVSTRGELDKEMNESMKIGENAKMQRRGLRGLLTFLVENKVLFIGINHIVANISRMPNAPQETSTGGSGWEFYPSVRIKLRCKQIVDAKSSARTGIEMFATVVKNRHDFPFRTAQILLDFNRGFDDTASLVNFACDKGILPTKTGWVTFEGQSHRKTALIDLFKTTPEKYEWLKNACIGVMRATDVAADAFIPEGS